MAGRLRERPDPGTFADPAAALLAEAQLFCARPGAAKLPVVWIGTNCSCDNSISFMNTTAPDVWQVFSSIIDLYYSNAFMAADGEAAWGLLAEVSTAHQGRFVLVVEGAIPLNGAGRYTIVARTMERDWTARDVVTWLGAKAGYVLALGTCGCYGGASAAAPDVSGSVGVSAVLDREVVNISGCPVNPDWYVGTLAHLLLYGIPELDDVGRPSLFYGETVHRNCQRRSYFDDGDFAEELGSVKCMFSQGCVGPRTGADCPYRLWINHVSYPIKVNTPCIGCTNPDFPDGSSPFFTPLPEKRAGGRDSGGGRPGDRTGEG